MRIECEIFYQVKRHIVPQMWINLTNKTGLNLETETVFY
jgi:hypothetical protein